MPFVAEPKSAATGGKKSSGTGVREVLPRKGLLYQEDGAPLALCRPKLLPLKSVTLEKLEAMQAAAQEKSKEQRLRQQQDLNASSEGRF
ncbi:BBSome interacting protein 1 [Oratosquilla oratoria]|uniref:BBSome interacting protein 1 n=1 Tax=Oratosquilla oratoria TaxID=337810 RepID=UPI003F75F77A